MSLDCDASDRTFDRQLAHLGCSMTPHRYSAMGPRFPEPVACWPLWGERALSDQPQALRRDRSGLLWPAHDVADPSAHGAAAHQEARAAQGTRSGRLGLGRPAPAPWWPATGPTTAPPPGASGCGEFERPPLLAERFLRLPDDRNCDLADHRGIELVDYLQLRKRRLLRRALHVASRLRIRQRRLFAAITHLRRCSLQLFGPPSSPTGVRRSSGAPRRRKPVAGNRVP
jgi:hypothetical protein